LRSQPLGTFEVQLDPFALLLGRISMDFERMDDPQGVLEGQLVAGLSRGIKGASGRVATSQMFAPLPIGQATGPGRSADMFMSVTRWGALHPGQKQPAVAEGAPGRGTGRRKAEPARNRRGRNRQERRDHQRKGDRLYGIHPVYVAGP
jgi:hypothetical protein